MAEPEPIDERLDDLGGTLVYLDDVLIPELERTLKTAREQADKANDLLNQVLKEREAQRR